MEPMEIFNDKDDEILITLVFQHPLLYNVNNEDYKNTKNKEKVWSEIGKKLNKKSEHCKKHWKNLKDTYYRQKRKHIGSTGPKNPRSKYWHYAKLFSFLDSIPNKRTTICNIDPYQITLQESQSSQISQDKSESQADNSGTDDTSSPTDISPTSSPLPTYVNVLYPKSINKKRLKKEFLTYPDEEIPCQNVFENIHQHNDDDEFSSFSEHVKVVLKKLQPLQRIQAKREIFEILMKYELLDVETNQRP